MYPLTLETERLVLREYREGDWVHTNQYESDPELTRYTSYEPRSLEQSRAFVLNVMAEAQKSPRAVFELAVVPRGKKDLIGKVGFAIRDFQNRDAELWFTLKREAQGKGYAAEAMRTLVDFGFRALGLHRLYGDCDPRNHASAKLMERLGMRREGRFRKNVFLKNEWCDSLIYAVLEDEWALVRR